MHLPNPLKNRKSETSKKPRFSNNKKKPPVIHNISKPIVNHSLPELNITTPKKEIDQDLSSYTSGQTSEPVSKTYITPKHTESDYSYQDMPQLYHSREHFSDLEDTSKSILKAYHQEKKKKKLKKKSNKEAKQEASKNKETGIPFNFLMSKDVIPDSANTDKTRKKTHLFQFSIWQCLKNFAGKCKNNLQKIYYTIYEILSGKHIAKEFFWTGTIVAICSIIALVLSNNQKHNMIFYSLKDNTIHLANAEQLASQYDLTTQPDYEDDNLAEEEDYDDYEDWEDEEDYDQYEDFEEEEYEDWEDEEDYDQYEDFEEEEYEDWEDEEEYISPIDFDYLRENDDSIYAWIYIPGTVIDDPIIQNDEDDYYSLEYAFDYTDYEDEDEDLYDDDDESEEEYEDFSGYIYTENITSTDFTDNNTIIYGHNMENGTIFSELEEFLDAAFFQQCDTLYIYTPEEELEYTIFAAYLFEDIDLGNTFDFSDEEIYSTYISKLMNINSSSANIRSNVTVTDKDKIITLITTYSEDPDQRVYVQAVLNTSN